MAKHNPARRRHQVMAVGLLAGLIALGVPWISIRLSTGAEGGATWSDFSAASFSLALAAVAAWGATLLTRPVATRVVAAGQALLAVGALLGIAYAVNNAGLTAVALAGEITGVLGTFGSQDITWSWNPWAVGLAVTASGMFFVSGILGVIWPGTRTNHSRFEQGAAAPSEHPWDALTDGNDPTAR